MLAKKTYKNQVTIPKGALDGIEDVEYFDVRREDDAIILRPVNVTGAGESLRKVRRKFREMGIKPRDVDNAVKWARAR